MLNPLPSRRRLMEPRRAGHSITAGSGAPDSTLPRQKAVRFGDIFLHVGNTETVTIGGLVSTLQRCAGKMPFPTLPLRSEKGREVY